MDNKFLSLGELAETTGLPVGWIKRETDAGNIPYLQVGRRRMYDLRRVREVLDQRAASSKKGGAI